MRKRQNRRTEIGSSALLRFKTAFLGHSRALRLCNLHFYSLRMAPNAVKVRQKMLSADKRDGLRERKKRRTKRQGAGDAPLPRFSLQRERYGRAGFYGRGKIGHFLRLRGKAEKTPQCAILMTGNGGRF